MYVKHIADRSVQSFAQVSGKELMVRNFVLYALGGVEMCRPDLAHNVGHAAQTLTKVHKGVQ